MSYYNIKNNERTFFYLLSIVDKLFKKHDIEYWLDCGTLLGAIREGSYIEWDNDFDISIHLKDIKRVKMLKDEFKEYDINLTGYVTLGVNIANASMCIFPQHTVKRNNKKYLVQYRYPMYHWINHFVNKISPKFNEMLKQSEIYYYLCSKIKLLETIRSPLKNLGNMAYVNFCNSVCPIPQYPDEYLTYMFGDWRTPHQFKKHKDVNNMYNVRSYK